MKFMLSDEVQVEGYAKLLNLTTRADMVDNKYFKAEPLVQDVAKALAVGRTPYTLNFFEQINSPQGPWLQMLQRAYYTDEDLDKIIADAQGADEGDRRRIDARLYSRAAADAAALSATRSAAASPTSRGRGRSPGDGRQDRAIARIRRHASVDAQGCSGCSIWRRRLSSFSSLPFTRSSRWSGCRSTIGR